MKIRAVIWDMGGVLLRTEDQRPRQKLAELLQIPDGKIEKLVFDSDSSRCAQLGKIGVEEHWDFIRAELGLSPHEMPEVRRMFWAGDELDEGLVNTIRDLKRAAYKTGLLSNAFPETLKFIVEECKIADAFDQIVISAEEGIMKPDERIYQIALEKLDINASDAVFIDDSPENITGAQQAGLFTIQFKNANQVRLKLKELLNGVFYE